METHPTVVILKADQLYAATLRAHVEAVLPGARITIAPHVAAARTLLDRAPVDLLLGSLGEGPEGDALDLLAQSTRAPRRARRVLVVALRLKVIALVQHCNQVVQLADMVIVEAVVTITVDSRLVEVEEQAVLVKEDMTLQQAVMVVLVDYFLILQLEELMQVIL